MEDGKPRRSEEAEAERPAHHFGALERLVDSGGEATGEQRVGMKEKELCAARRGRPTIERLRARQRTFD